MDGGGAAGTTRADGGAELAAEAVHGEPKRVWVALHEVVFAEVFTEATRRARTHTRAHARAQPSAQPRTHTRG